MPPPEEHGFQAGLLYVVATLLPLASFVVLLVLGGLRNFVRRHKEAGGASLGLYNLLGGDTPGRLSAYIATAAIGLAFVCSVIGFVNLQHDMHEAHELEHKVQVKIAERTNLAQEAEKAGKNAEEKLEKLHHEIEELEKEHARAEALPRFKDSFKWARIAPASTAKYDEKTKLEDRLAAPATLLSVGYRIDNLAAIMFLMV